MKERRTQPGCLGGLPPKNARSIHRPPWAWSRRPQLLGGQAPQTPRVFVLISRCVQLGLAVFALSLVFVAGERARADEVSRQDPNDKPSPIALFNGRDLAGWKQTGRARWEVRDGVLIGQQGPENAPGDLLTEASFADFELKVTFRVEWPANSGVWYRYQSARQAYQADILEYKDPLAWTGTLYCTGKMFIAINEDPQLVNRNDWNTLVIRAVGNRHIVVLNGTTVADVRDDTSDHGRIGFQIHAGDQFAKMRLFVKEVSLRQF